MPIIKKTLFIPFVLMIILSFSCSRNPIENEDRDANDSHPNYLAITNVGIGDPGETEYRMINMDIRWDNWQSSSYSHNWDAVWIFLKYRIGDGEWRHGTLSNSVDEHHCPDGYLIMTPSDGKGVYLRINGLGAGYINASDISLRWNYGQDNVADDADVSVRVFGLEMVYIPEGSFYAGDNGHSFASLTKGANDNRPWHITSENAIEVTDTESDGYYYNSSKDFWNDRWNASEDLTGSSFTIPSDFPKGYRAIYCMKYEISQQQYVDFLNTLTDAQWANRYDRVNYNQYGYTIHENNGVFSTEHPARVCGFLTASDGCAFADWAALRPMTELEFEKICRGSDNQPVEGEFAWGSTTFRNATGVNGSEDDRAHITNIGANSYFAESDGTHRFLLNKGIFFDSGKSREQIGASYYGVMEMSGNVNETCISIGCSDGRAFTFHNGDGRLAVDGFTDRPNWPQADGIGAGYKGGNLAREAHEMRISERNDATVELDYDHRHIPLGFRCVRTVQF